MICDACRGTGRIEVPIKVAPELRGRLMTACYDCGGSGFSHCCCGEDIDMACKPTEPLPRRR